MSIVHPRGRHAGPRSLLAGLAAGAIAALAASVLSLPLRSPDDVYFNTVTVTAGALLAGLWAGLTWWWAQGGHSPLRQFLLTMAGSAVAVTAATLAAEAAPNAPLDGITRFVLPLAGVVFLTVTLLTPLLARPLADARLTGAASALVTVAAVVVGVALAGRGDTENGRLALPLPPPASSAAATAPTDPDADPYAAREPAASPAPATGASPAAAGAQAAPSAQGNEALLRPADVAGVTFSVVPAESAATYTVRQKLASLPLPNEVVGRTNAVSGTVHLDGGASNVRIDLRTLDSGQPERDTNLRRRLGLPFDQHPFAEFNVSNLADLPAEYHAGDSVKREVTGTMKLREVERPLTFEVEARLQDGVLFVLGTTDFTWSDFQIPPPNVAGFVQVEDNVHVEVLLVAKRSTGG